MNQINIDTFFGDISIHLEVTRIFSDTYQVWINKHYHGVILQSADGWIIHVHPDTILQGDDVAVIIDMIEENLMNGKFELIQ